jgi:SAM-dependent methyltransferase
MSPNKDLNELKGEHRQVVYEYFSETSKYWADIYGADNNTLSHYHNYSMTKRKNLAIQLLDNYAGGRSLRVLDAGCGPGVALEDIFQRGHDAVGIDISENMVNDANKRLAKYVHDGSPCRTGDIEALPFEQDSFDAVLSLGVLMYLPTDHQALSEISRVVNSGGILLLNVPNLVRINMLFDPYYLYRAVKYAWHLSTRGRNSPKKSLAPLDIRSNEHFTNRRYLFTKLTKLLNEHNFTNVKIIGAHYSPMTFFGTDIMRIKENVALSENLARLSGKKGFGWLHALASEWVICATRI